MNTRWRRWKKGYILSRRPCSSGLALSLIGNIKMKTEVRTGRRCLTRIRIVINSSSKSGSFIASPAGGGTGSNLHFLVSIVEKRTDCVWNLSQFLQQPGNIFGIYFNNISAASLGLKKAPCIALSPRSIWNKIEIETKIEMKRQKLEDEYLCR